MVHTQDLVEQGMSLACTPGIVYEEYIIAKEVPHVAAGEHATLLT
jgi:hypothetical protein